MYEVFRIIADTHSLSTTSCRSFDHNWVSHVICDLLPCFCLINGIFCTRNYWNSSIHHCLSCCGFVTHAVNDFCGWSNKCDIAFFTHSYKFAILRQKSESRMNCIRSDCHCSPKYTFHVKITVFGRCWSDTDRLVCQLGMECIFICFRTDCYGHDIHLTARTDDTHCDLSSVCN